MLLALLPASVWRGSPGRPAGQGHRYRSAPRAEVHNEAEEDLVPHHHRDGEAPPPQRRGWRAPCERGCVTAPPVASRRESLFSKNAAGLWFLWGWAAHSRSCQHRSDCSGRAGMGHCSESQPRQGRPPPVGPSAWLLLHLSSSGRIDSFRRLLPLPSNIATDSALRSPLAQDDCHSQCRHGEHDIAERCPNGLAVNPKARGCCAGAHPLDRLSSSLPRLLCKKDPWLRAQNGFQIVIPHFCFFCGAHPQRSSFRSIPATAARCGHQRRRDDNGRWRTSSRNTCVVAPLSTLRREK